MIDMPKSEYAKNQPTYKREKQYIVTMNLFNNSRNNCPSLATEIFKQIKKKAIGKNRWHI